MNVYQMRAGPSPFEAQWQDPPHISHSSHTSNNTNHHPSGGHDDHELHIPSRRTFRRPRAGRACGTCHSRRVRCDAGSRGLPCTNCEAFSLPCSIPPKKKKKRDGDTAGNLKRTKRGRSSRDDQPNEDDDIPEPSSAVSAATATSATPHDFASLILQANEHIKQQPDEADTYATLIKPEVVKSEIDPGRVAYLEEFSNLSLLIHDYDEPVSGVHYPLPKSGNDSIELSTQMNEVELQILEKRGALSLPPRELCDELVHAYFEWVAPIVPLIDQSRFMRQYKDPKNPPSILLMQAILLAGSRVCTTDMLMDSNGSPIPAATLFYKRAKALYDADYEQDRVIIVQALILMGWYWEEPGTVTKNVFYWNGLAVAIAQGFGMHRSAANSKLSTADKKLWKRIWWTLFTRDRSVAVALGRPALINLNDSDVEMICEDDFFEEGSNKSSCVRIQFFVQYVKLCEIMDLVLLQNYSISARARQYNAMALTQCDMALAHWLQNCPKALKWDPSRYSFWSAYLNTIFQTTICLLHRAHLPPDPSPQTHTSLSRSPAFHAANTITAIAEILMAHDELRYCPPFIIYSILSTLVVHIYQLHIAIPTASVAQIQRVAVCMHALESVSEIWLVAKAVQALFDSVLISAGYEDQLQTIGGYSSQKPLIDPGDSPTTSVKKEFTLPHRPRANSSQSPITKTMPLTPALQAWTDIASKLAVTSQTPRSASTSHDDSSSKSSSVSGNLEPRVFSSHWRNPSQEELVPRAYQAVPLASQQVPVPLDNGFYQPYPQLNFWPDEQNLAWNPHPIDGTPAPIGYNATEWFQFFGVQ